MTTKNLGALLPILLPILAIFAVGRPLFAEESAWIRITAASAIQGNDLDAAREAAIVEARQRTLREVLRPMLGPEELQKQMPRIQTVFLQQPEPYFAAFQIENEEIIDDGQRYQVITRADVRRKTVSAALVEQRIADPLSVASKPTVMVLVRERFESRASGTRAAEMALLKALEKHGFKIVDPEQKKLVDLRNRLFAEGAGDVRMALQSAMAFQADYLIFGEAAVGSSGPLAGTDLKARHASVSIKLVEASSGVIVTTESGEGSRKHADELTGGNWALEDAASAATEKLLARFQDILKNEVMNGAEILVDLYGLDYESQAAEAESLLQKTAGVRGVLRCMFFPGMVRFELKLTGPVTDLTQNLKNAEIDGQGVEIVEALPRYLRLKRAGGQKMVDTDTSELNRRYVQEKYKLLDMEKAREQDKEVIAKIDEFAASKKVSDEQKKQLYAVRKEIELKRIEMQTRQHELKEREIELKKAEAQKRDMEKRAKDLEQKAAAARSTQQQLRADLQKAGLQKADLQKASEQTYVATRNYANARSSHSASSIDYVNVVQQGLQLGNQIAGFLSGF